MNISDTSDFQNYLESNNIYFINNIRCVEKLYGIEISQSNNINISILNLFVREYNIKINKMNVLQEIYHADCRKKYSEDKQNGILISNPVDFNNKIFKINIFFNIMIYLKIIANHYLINMVINRCKHFINKIKLNKNNFLKHIHKKLY